MKNKNVQDTQPWFRNYDQEVSQHLDYPNVSVPGLLDIQVTKNESRIAIVEGFRSLSYAGLQMSAKSFAKILISSGLKRGDRVGICLQNTIEFVISYFGILYAGGVVCALNPAFPNIELESQIRLTGVQRIIASIEKAPDLQDLLHDLQISSLIVVGDKVIHPGSGSAEVIDLMAIGSSNPEQITLEQGDPESPAVLQFSGGTTGIPKVAVASHRNIVSNVTQFRAWIHSLKDGQETFLVAIPLYHVYGMVLGLNLGVYIGATMVLFPNARDVTGMLEAIEKHHVTYFPGVPSLLNMINSHPLVTSGMVNMSGIKACISGSAPLLRETKEVFEQRTGGRLIEGYGLSEAPTATHCNPLTGLNKIGSIGLPLPDVDCRIVKTENYTEDVGPGEVGELLIKGPQVMMGYLNNPEETNDAFLNGWLRTGDAVRMDDEGYFYIVGRIKELIKVHGMQVWPIEVEEVLHLHPKIKEVAVAGLPDVNKGEKVIAWIVLNDNVELSLEEIHRFCSGKLAGYKIPSAVMFLTGLPRSSIGKVLRRVLIKGM